jgi:hypothetical protein
MAMNLNSEHLKAILKVNHLRDQLLDETFTEEDCKNFDRLKEGKRKMITAQVMYVMNHGFASHLITYSSPIDHYVDPIRIYGEEGIYLVHEKNYEKSTFFTNKSQAYSYANEAYNNWLENYIHED